MNLQAAAIAVVLTATITVAVMLIINRITRGADTLSRKLYLFEERVKWATSREELAKIREELLSFVCAYRAGRNIMTRHDSMRVNEIRVFINGRLHGKRWTYVRCLVRKADPGQVTLMSSLAEKVTGAPQPDVIPDVHAGSLSFEHSFIDAKNANDAYAIGPKTLGEIPADVICMNDYVIENQ